MSAADEAIRQAKEHKPWVGHQRSETLREAHPDEPWAVDQCMDCLKRERDEYREAAAAEAHLADDFKVRLKEAEAVAQDALDILGPCDDDNAHVEVWCINHQEKRCDVPDLRRRLAALATPPNQEDEG